MNYLLVIEVNHMTYKNIVKVDQAELNVYIEGEKDLSLYLWQDLK